MNPDAISEEMLNSLLDNELDARERAQLLAVIAQDPQLKRRYDDLRQLKELVQLAYQNPPAPLNLRRASSGRFQFSLPLTAASAALVVVGITLGWFIKSELQPPAANNIRSISQIQAQQLPARKVLLHIDALDDRRIRSLLETAENMLHDQNNHDLQVEIVANAEGLGMLRKNSPYRQQIATLSENYKNVSFLACGIAKQSAALKEGRDIELLPEAKDIPAALEQILNRLREGWIYVRG